MTKDEVFEKMFSSPLISSWHWFQWHFKHQLNGAYNPFSDAIVSAISEVDGKIPGYAEEFIKSFATISGRKEHLPHYEQLLQLLAELHIIRQLVIYDWPSLEGFEFEPTALGSPKNPEISIKFNDIEVGVEVKSPSLISHINNRSTNSTQLVGRVFTKEDLKNIVNGSDGVTLPRDNPMKDFLVSANGKFQAFKKDRKNYFGILVVVWDDFIYEPISALLHSEGGLFTESSFYTDKDSNSVKFPYVDGVIVVRHLHQLMRASRGESLIDSCKGALEYGSDGDFPQKAFIVNPLSTGSPKDVLSALQAYTPTSELGTEYTPKDIVWWL